MDMLIAFGAFVLVMAILFLIRNKVSLFWTASLFLLSTVLYIKFGIQPPIPGSIVALYTITSLLSVLLYVTSSEAQRQSFFGPIMAMITEDRLKLVRFGVLLCVPALLAWQGYYMSLPSDAPPPRSRQVHPPVPNSISFQGLNEAAARDVDLIKEVNPLRELQDTDPEKFKTKVELGKTIYYENCYYCHGDHLAADGHYAITVKPVPADFQDAGTLPMLEESFLFWRIAKGGPGLPDAATPWDSSMPVWEKFLTEDEIWSVILFLYDHTGFEPRAKAEAH